MAPDRRQEGTHGTKTSYRRDCSCNGADHPNGHDVGGGCAGVANLSDLPASISALVLSDMRDHALLFCLLGLVLTATIILVTAPEAVTWALSLID
jgi:hypothetical protein